MVQVFDLPRNDIRANAEPELAVAVVIPCYRVSRFIISVLERIGTEVTSVYVVDDQCPESTGSLVEQQCEDPRVHVVYNTRNLGVGGATMAGYRQALADGADIIVKIDGDGQMDPALIAKFVAPIAAGTADYSKGNRFFHLDHLRGMPFIRTLGNGVLSLLTKLSTGYWDIVDPTNGFTCIHAQVAEHLPLGKISQRYFFESDLLFRLSLLRAVVVDIPIPSHYADEESQLRITKVIPEFLAKHLRNGLKRLFYNYFLRNFSVATLEILCGLALLLFGIGFGGYHWYMNAQAHTTATSGTVMVGAMPVLLGFQLLLSALSFDVQDVPRRALHPRL